MYEKMIKAISMTSHTIQRLDQSLSFFAPYSPIKKSKRVIFHNFLQNSKYEIDYLSSLLTGIAISTISVAK